MPYAEHSIRPAAIKKRNVMRRKLKTIQEAAADEQYIKRAKMDDPALFAGISGNANKSAKPFEPVERLLSGQFLLAGAYLRDIRDYAAIKTRTGQDVRGTHNSLTDLVEKEGDESYAVNTVVNNLFDMAEKGNAAAAVALFSSYLLPLIDHHMIDLDDKIIINIFDILEKFPIPDHPIKQTQSHIHILMALGYMHKEGCGTPKAPLTSAYFYARAAKMQFTANPHDTETQGMILDAMNEALTLIDKTNNNDKNILIRWGGLTKLNIRQNPKDHSAHQNVLEGLMDQFERVLNAQNGQEVTRNRNTYSSPLRFDQ